MSVRATGEIEVAAAPQLLQEARRQHSVAVVERADMLGTRDRVIVRREAVSGPWGLAAQLSVRITFAEAASLDARWSHCRTE
jgi:hypothetical protein